MEPNDVEHILLNNCNSEKSERRAFKGCQILI